MYLCVSGALVGFLETGGFVIDQFLQLLLGKVVELHGESERLLCYWLHTNTHTQTHNTNIQVEAQM